MKKGILLLSGALLLGTLITGCGPKTCKEDGCTETDIYEDGYCQWHYYENTAGDVLEEIFK